MSCCETHLQQQSVHQPLSLYEPLPQGMETVLIQIAVVVRALLKVVYHVLANMDGHGEAI